MKRLVFATLAFALSATACFADERTAASYNAARGGVSLVVMRNGQLAFEDYPNSGAPDKAWELASGTKSFSGVIAAAAVMDGLLDLDEEAADTLTEWRADPEKSAITVRQILNLSSGVRSDGVGRPPTYADAIAKDQDTAPGEAFEYGPVNFQIFGEIMRRKLQSFEGGKYPDARAYLQARVLDPLSIRPAQWNRGRDGYPTLPSGADLTARDWARFGQFVLDGGQVDGEAIVDGEALAECFKPSDANPGYGLTWWLNTDDTAKARAAMGSMRAASDLFDHPRRDALPGDLVMAAGAGGQRLYLIPSAGLVVVRQYPRLLERRLGARGKRFSDVEFLLTLLED